MGETGCQFGCRDGVITDTDLGGEGTSSFCPIHGKDVHASDLPPSTCPTCGGPPRDRYYRDHGDGPPSRCSDAFHADPVPAPSSEGLLAEAVREYADHQSWRCQHPDRYPWDPDCCCGLIDFLSRCKAAGIEVPASIMEPR